MRAAQRQTPKATQRAIKLLNDLGREGLTVQEIADIAAEFEHITFDLLQQEYEARQKALRDQLYNKG